MEVFHRKQQLLRCFSLLSRSKTSSPFYPSPLSNSICENRLNPKPTTTHLHFSVFSNGSHSIRSIMIPFYQSLIRVREKIRYFSVSASEFENALVMGSDMNNTDEKLSKDKKFKNDSSLSNDENDSSKVNNVDDDKAEAVKKQVNTIVDAIRNCKEEKLDKEIFPEDENFSSHLVSEIFSVLNSERVSGVPFMVWAQDENMELFNDADFRSLIINNCGWLEDYDTMQRLLQRFSEHEFCLTYKAFGYFANFVGDKELAMESIRKIVGILNKAGGTCRGTGLIGLIKMLCKLDLIDMAMFVIQITDKKKISHYNIIVLEMCMRSRFEEAHNLLEKMRESNCDPDVLSYTYIISALCKNDKIKDACDLLEEMEKKVCKPDALCFEIIILYMCKLGKMDIASKYFDHMVNEGLVPRINTNAALINGYFKLEKYEEAHKFVVNLGDKHKSCGTSAYSLLASLHYRKKEVVTAGKLVIEMMDNNFIPQFSFYKLMWRQLLKIGNEEMAKDIQVRFSKFRSGLQKPLLTETRG